MVHPDCFSPVFSPAYHCIAKGLSLYASLPGGIGKLPGIQPAFSRQVILGTACTSTDWRHVVSDCKSYVHHFERMMMIVIWYDWYVTECDWYLDVSSQKNSWFNRRKLEVKLPTIWTDEKAEVGRGREEKRRRDKIREKKESEERRCRCGKM